MQCLKLQTVSIMIIVLLELLPRQRIHNLSVKLMNIGPLTFSSLQESMRADDLLRKGKRRKTTTQAVQVNLNDQHEIENTHLTELPSSDNACQYVKDRLTGNITCMVCGEEGHDTCDCSMKDKEEKVICTLCNRVGHCHLWCCRQNVSENRACHRCGEKGHYTKKKLSCGQQCGHSKDISCSSCDMNHWKMSYGRHYMFHL